jgi:hypothetical protein
MTFPCIRILALVVMAGLPLAAQQQPSSPPAQPSTSPQPRNPQASNPESGSSAGNPQTEPVPSTADSPEIANPALRPVTGELENKLDTKDAKNGDAVVIKTTGTAATANGIEIPKGSRIVGHVIDVAARGAGGDNSRVTIQFDHAEIKGGQRLPILSVIQAVAPAGSSSVPESAQGGPPATAPGAASGPAGQTGTGQATGNDSSAGGTQTSPSAQSAAGGPPPVGTVVARKGNIAIRTTAIPGVLLVGNANGQPFSNASGALVGAQQDVSLNNGTVMVVAIAMMPARPNAH